ncbi:hypothetical protein D3C85_1755040 [compost metagenome]
MYFGDKLYTLNSELAIGSVLLLVGNNSPTSPPIPFRSVDTVTGVLSNVPVPTTATLIAFTSLMPCISGLK